MATIEEVMKVDLAHKSDYIKRSDGDLDTQTGLDNLKWALFHRLITSPGSLVHRPTYGVGIKDFQNAPSSNSAQIQLAIKIKDQFELDPRVEEVMGTRYEVDDARPEMTKVIVRVKPVGYDEDTVTFTPFGEGGVL